ncbi:MAG: hypothetical protein MUC36_01350 [Planctomycetes bacterium]|jgi:hypothetical protein|nr:hypothetical protein [Planctomycetota bacterium]
MKLHAVAAFACAGMAAAQAPRITNALPAGGTRGTEVRIALRGERLTGACDLLLVEPGLELLGVDAGDAGKCTLRLRIAADCRLGPHALRLRTPNGLSNLLSFQIGALPSVAEARDGEAAMGLEPGRGLTVDGALRDGELDRYSIQAEAGVPLCIDVEAMRLGLVAMDLQLCVRDADGHELARADDSALGYRDPRLVVTPPRSGPLDIELRGAVPGDGRDCSYRLHLGPLPLPFGAVPGGGQPGEELDVLLLGAEALGPVRVRLPDDGSERMALVPQWPDAVASSPLWLAIGGPANAAPVAGDDGMFALTVPSTVHGTVTGSEPVRYRWLAKKGEEVEFRVLARSLRSELDPVLTVRAPDGRVLGSNDDSRGADSVLRATAASDGAHTVEVRDLVPRGSPRHWFRLEAGPRERPRRVTMVTGRLGDAVVGVAQGGHAALVLQRTGLGADERLAIDGLPAGVTAELGPQLPGSSQLAVLLSAAPDAGLAATAARIGLAAGDGGFDGRVFRQPIPLLNGRNDAPLLQTTSGVLPVVVTAPLPFAVHATPPVVPLIRGASLLLAVAIRRDQGFDGRVRVKPAWSPPGLTTGQASLERDATNAELPLEAAADAPLGTFPLLLVASTRREQVGVEQALPFVSVQIEEPWSKLERGSARGRQGGTAELRLPITDRLPRRGPAPAVLLGLPRGATAEPVTVAPEAKEVVFVIQLAADAPVGKHRDLRVELRLPDADGRPVLHRFAAGELRLDRAGAKP